MKIQSKKTFVMHEVTMAEWEGMKKRYAHRNYKVIIDDDDHIGSVEVKVEPISLTAEFVEEDTEESDRVEWVNGIDFYKAELTKMGIPFHYNTGIEKLKQKYEDNL